MRAKNLVGGVFDLTGLSFLVTWLFGGSDVFGVMTAPAATIGLILHMMERHTRGVFQQINQAHQFAAQVRAAAYTGRPLPIMQINADGTPGAGQPRQITIVVPPNSGQPQGVLPPNIRIVQQPDQTQYRPPPYGYPPSRPPHSL